jgi:hypothetical protein
VSSGLYSGTSGLALGTGLSKGALGLYSGASGLQSGGGGGPTLPFSSVNTDGWSVEYTATPPSLNPGATFNVSQAGFDDSGNATTVTETLTATQRVRLAYPNQATLSSNRVALSGELLSTTTISGVTNSSTLTSPAPIVNWVMQSRVLVGDTVRVGVTGNHWAARSGRPFRCVVFTATDGTNTVTATVTAMTVSTTGAGDQHSVLAYETTLNIASLANPNDITVNAKVYPWIGGASSIADSSLGSGRREFSPRVFRRDTAKFANPNVIYVAAGGVDLTAYVGTDRTLAALSPALTVNGALNRARAVLGTASGALDNLEINLTEGTWVLAASPTGNTTNFCVTITPAPGALKVNTIYQFGAANINPGVTYLRLKGLTISRQGTFYVYSGATGFCIIEDCTFDTNGSTGAIVLGTSANVVFWNGVVCPASMGNIFAPGTSSENAMIRGVNSQTSTGTFQSFLVLGSKFNGGAASDSATPSSNNSIVQFCSFRNPPTANAVVSIAFPVTGFSFSQNLIEVVQTTGGPSLRPSSDAATNDLTHVLMDNITLAAGHFTVGRINMFYDETPLVYRVHKFCRLRNSVAGSVYNKGDVFLSIADPADAPLHTGNWAQLYGVGCRNVHTLFINIGTNGLGNNQGQAYGGVGSAIATTEATPQYSLAAGVNFTNWTAVTTNSGTSAAVAGTAGGTYTLPGGSALLNRVAAADEVFPFDLDGTARTRGSVGAYA